MILITGSARIRPEHRDLAVRIGVEHSVRSRGEPGCLAHNCHIDAEDPLRIVFVEEWTDMDAVKAHFSVPKSAQFVRDIAAMAEAPPVMRLFGAERVTV